jgi:uncharacterized Zn finger protein (UPF0148 family)
MAYTTELVRRGASILQEACPRCGAVQIRYKGKAYCTNEDDLEALLNSGTSPEPTGPKVEAPTSLPAQPPSQANEALRKMMETKLSEVSKQLDSTTDINEQARLLDLISKYVETLDKLRRSSA